MKQAWRWYGPDDPVSLRDAKQAGASGIVTALHHITPGDTWPVSEIKKRKDQVEAMGLTWDVVESVFISDDIKAQTGDWRAHLDKYKQSLRNLAACGVHVVAYHTMPVLDWTRTDLKWQHKNTGLALRFDPVELAAFDIHILQRKGAAESYSPEVAEASGEIFAKADDLWKSTLANTLTAGLPGSAEGWSLDEFRARLAVWDRFTPEQVFANHVDFLSEIAPLAEEIGIRLACHPDDPPFPILGLPRIMSTEADFKAMFSEVDLPSNGMTFCTGSLGARADNDLPGMATRLGPRIHFAHLRNVRRETEGTPCVFHEDDHLTGSSDMVRIIEALLNEEKRRASLPDAIEIPMRPDHGHELLSDINAGGNPGYTAIGRLKGLAELRGVILALQERVI